MKLCNMHDIVVSSILPMYVLSTALCIILRPGTRQRLATHIILVLARASLVLSQKAVIWNETTCVHACTHNLKMASYATDSSCTIL